MYTQFDQWVTYDPETNTFVFDTSVTPPLEYMKGKSRKRSANLTSSEELYEVLKENIYEHGEDES